METVHASPPDDRWKDTGGTSFSIRTFLGLLSPVAAVGKCDQRAVGEDLNAKDVADGVAHALDLVHLQEEWHELHY